MADRVPVTIRLGGALPRALVPAFLAVLAAEALCSDDRSDFDIQHIPTDSPIEFSEGEVSWGISNSSSNFASSTICPSHVGAGPVPARGMPSG